MTESNSVLLGNGDGTFANAVGGGFAADGLLASAI